MGVLKALKAVARLPHGAQAREIEAESARRREAEDQLADTRQYLAVTLASTDAGFIATDRDGRIRRMNSFAERLLGWPQEEAAGQPLGQVFVLHESGQDAPPREEHPLDALIALDGAGEAPREVTVAGRDGVRTALELKTSPIHAPDGAVKGMAMVFRDLTARMQAAAESGHLAAIVESSHDAIVARCLEGRITSWNAAAQALFGYTPAEALDQPVQMLIPPERDIEETQIMAQIMRGEKVASFDTVRLAKGGRRLDVSVTVSPVRDGQGRIIGASKIVRDIAQQRETERALRASDLKAQQLAAENRQIHEANRLKSQFLANMSHELRTPLNAIIGFADLLHGGLVEPDAPQHQEFLGHIAVSGRHLLQLINNILDLSKVESGRFDFEPQDIDLAALVKEVGDLLSKALERKHLGLSVEIPASLGPIHLDAARLKQVLYNYLSNSIKFTPEHGAIVVRALGEGPAHFRIEVEDSGIGIAPEDLRHLFSSEFQQLDAGYNKQYPGTGLGLALTRRLVEAQGGSVGVRSVPGVGSVFHLVLNRIHGTDKPAAAPRSPA